MGDPCGIGPEVVLRALARPSVRRLARFVLIGGAAVFRRVAREFGIEVAGLRTVKAFPKSLRTGRACVWNACSVPARLALRGEATEEGGRASVACILCAIDLAVEGKIDAIVTAPINKLAIHVAGHEWPGHTEMLADRTGTPKPVMMMVGGGLRVPLVTTHASIRDVPDLITRQNVLATLRIASHALQRYFRLKGPRIAVCGLNPHAGESGRFGDEEETAIRPAMEDARGEGIVVCAGPVPADVVFGQALKGAYDAVVAMYHDQGNLPVKLLAFETGVNVTLGLPIIRPSPDHGTAYDIVRQGRADPRSMIAAIRVAARMARAEVRWTAEDAKSAKDGNGKTIDRGQRASQMPAE